MASIKLSALVSAARGKVGGNVFSANKAGSFVRTYVKPTNRNTIPQQAVRGLFGTMSSSWRALTSEVRSQWNTIAVQYPYMNRLGDMATYSGQQLFNKLQSNINAVNAAGLIGAPAPALLTSPTTPQTFFPLVNGMSNFDLTANQFSTANVLCDNLQDVPTGFALIIECTSPLSAGITSPQKGLFKAINSIAEEQDLTDTGIWSNLYDGYVAVFGVPNTGDVFYTQIKQVSYASGEATVAQRILTTVTGS